MKNSTHFLACLRTQKPLFWAKNLRKITLFPSFSRRFAARKILPFAVFSWKTYIFGSFCDGKNFATKNRIFCVSFLIRMARRTKKQRSYCPEMKAYSGTVHMQGEFLLKRRNVQQGNWNTQLRNCKVSPLQHGGVLADLPPLAKWYEPISG